MAKRDNKRVATKTIHDKVWHDTVWAVHYGELKRGVGHPGTSKNLFRCVGEKLPLEALGDVCKHLKMQDISTNGVYIAHDSMGCPRYIGRGAIFSRLKAHAVTHSRELRYFSFFVVEDKKHEREVETLLVRASSFLLEFNTRKKRVGVLSGNVRDFEAGTHFYERQSKKGRAHKRKRAKKG
jgi:hypothetical protein